MAHKVDTMFSGEGVKPWHYTQTSDVTTITEGICTASEAIEAARLDWTVSKKPVEYAGKRVLDKYFLVRDDRNEAIGITGKVYTPVQNKDAFRFFDAVTLDPNGPKYVTAGSLRGGSIVWILAKLPKVLEVTPNDTIEQYLLLVNPHNGKAKWSMCYTPVRVVCNNTLTMAFRNKSRQVRFSHVGDAITPEKIKTAQDVLGIATDKANTLEEITKALLNHIPTEAEVNSVLDALLPQNNDAKYNTKTDNARAKVMELFHTGKGNDEKGVRGTSWSLYNAFTEYADHYRTIKTIKGMTPEESRMDSLIFGTSAKFKSDTLETILELSTR